MPEGNLLLIILSLSAVLTGFLAVLAERCKTKAILKRLNHMLDSAIDGSFSEHSFDESLLSSVENRMNQYLTASVVSARNLSGEKEKIKELLADISHQTKTPVSNMLLYAQLLEEQNLPGESGDCAAALKDQAEKLNFLIASLVKLSRLETGVLTMRPVINALGPMLKEAAGQFMPLADRKGLRFEVEATDASAVFDPKWTTEALCNLVDNAVKYTSQGAITLSVKVYDLFCRIDVADTGIGISEGEQARVFSRFYRSPSVSDKEGVGIGLYLTRQILAGQGGYVKVASSLGKGSVFSMFLPRKM